jgi:hypothetical protein
MPDNLLMPEGSDPYYGQRYMPGQTLSAYQPTLRDQTAQFLQNPVNRFWRLLGYDTQDQRPSPERNRLVEGITGSRGMGTTQFGAGEVLPVIGQIGAIQDAYRAGDDRSLAMALIPGAPKRGLLSLPIRYEPKGWSVPNPVEDWAKVRRIARAAERGDEVNPILYENDTILAGTHRASANELLDTLGRKGGRVDTVSLDDVMADPASFGLTRQASRRLRSAVAEGDFDDVDWIWQNRDGSHYRYGTRDNPISADPARVTQGTTDAQGYPGGSVSQSPPPSDLMAAYPSAQTPVSSPGQQAPAARSSMQNALSSGSYAPPAFEEATLGYSASGGNSANVVFRDDIIDIVKKYGIAAAASMYGMDAVNSAMGAAQDQPHNLLMQGY